MAARWGRPSEGSVSFCVDGSFRLDPRCMGWGGIVRDSQGLWQDGFHGYMIGESAFMAEAIALERGLHFVWDRGYRQVVCNVDCRNLLQALGDEEKCQLLPILGDIRELLQRRWVVSLSYVGRDCNASADWLAKRGASSPLDLECSLDSPPWELEVLILRDRLSSL
ncbi:uncharacterized protein LOC130713045 [Lotus japonicus]|uniref:uncharacterized protein LOC130713045 n=1 Tax=Lotus japonicus TaxID=34305 RepID=UPI002586ECB4|nr:uncharacterized protein LOC130713045 [Lotus japonicus]